MIGWKPCERHCYTSSLHVMAACPDCETPPEYIANTVHVQKVSDGTTLYYHIWRPRWPNA